MIKRLARHNIVLGGLVWDKIILVYVPVPHECASLAIDNAVVTDLDCIPISQPDRQI